jgi:hypothetical protein
VKSLWGRRRPPKPTGLDDRGVPFTFETEEFNANIREGVLKRWGEYSWAWVGGLLLAYFVIRAFLDPKPLWPLPPGWWIGVLFGVLGGLTARWSGHASRHDRIRSATVLAYGYCGACGYTLRELPTDTDHCRKCTECGAAWNTGRLVHADQSKQAAFNRLANLDGFHLSTMPLTDDRGVLLAEPYHWPTRRTRSLLPPLPARPDPALSREPLPTLHRRQLMFIAAAIWAGWALALGAYFIFAGGTEDSVSVVMLATLAAACATFASRGITLRTAIVRRVLLASGQCPSCSTDFDTALPLAPGFDGCTGCPGCLAAWKATDVGKGSPRT